MHGVLILNYSLLIISVSMCFFSHLRCGNHRNDTDDCAIASTYTKLLMPCLHVTCYNVMIIIHNVWYYATIYMLSWYKITQIGLLISFSHEHHNWSMKHTRLLVNSWIGLFCNKKKRKRLHEQKNRREEENTNRDKVEIDLIKKRESHRGESYHVTLSLFSKQSPLSCIYRLLLFNNFWL